MNIATALSNRSVGLLAVAVANAYYIQPLLVEVGEALSITIGFFNDAAIRTYLKLGLRHEGVRRSAVKVGTAPWDTAIFGPLRGERPEASGA